MNAVRRLRIFDLAPSAQRRRHGFSISLLIDADDVEVCIRRSLGNRGGRRRGSYGVDSIGGCRGVTELHDHTARHVAEGRVIHPLLLHCGPNRDSPDSLGG
ncbi:MAG: hypothetical protein DMF99_23595 [Acidobacteria bacterium]|nr:MAG: hypothetical protein DMF99_23595 [Acidobacteriota bacterium]